MGPSQATVITCTGVPGWARLPGAVPAQPAQLLPALDPTSYNLVLGWSSGELQKPRHRSWAAGGLCQEAEGTQGPCTGRLLHTARVLTQPEEGQAESMSVSIETTAAQGRALGCTGTWGLETALLPAPGPGMGVKAHVQTCVPRKSWQDLGLRASSGGTGAERCGSCAAKSGRGNGDR